MQRNFGHIVSALTVVGLLTLVGCSTTNAQKKSNGPTANLPVTTAASPTAAITTPSSKVPPTTVAPALSRSSRLRIDGIGPIDIGMTVARAQAVAGVELSMTSGPHCNQLSAPGGPGGVAMIITNPPSGRIDLIVVTEATVATVSGIRVGSTEAQLLAAYPGRLQAVNPSLPVHRELYHGIEPALADRAMVFVIDHGKVASISSGLRDKVEADETCA